MRVTAAAQHFGSLHGMAVVLPGRDVVLDGRLIEAGPAGPRIELVIGFEELCPATAAVVCSLFVVVPVFAGKCPFRALVTRNFVLLRAELFAPIGVGFGHFFSHRFLRSVLLGAPPGPKFRGALLALIPRRGEGAIITRHRSSSSRITALRAPSPGS